MRSVVLAAALAVGFAGFASAQKAPSPAVSSKTMTNADMDKVTAGAPALTVNGVGNNPGAATGNVLLGGANAQGVPPAPPSTNAWSGQATQAAKPCLTC